MSTPSRNGRVRRDESIDRKPLVGLERRDFEKSLPQKYKLKDKTLHLLHVLLAQFFCGKADCYPPISALMEWLQGWSESTIRRHLQLLRDAGITRMFEDRSIGSQRRLVLPDHSNGQAIIGELVANQNVREMISEHAPRGSKTDAPRGVKTNRCRGVTQDDTQNIPVPVQTKRFKQTVRTQEEISLPLNGNGRPQEVVAALPPKTSDSPQEPTAAAPPPLAALPPMYNGRALSQTQAELLAMFTPEMRQQLDHAPAELREEILRTWRNGCIKPSALEVIKIKLANAQNRPTTAEVLSHIPAPAAAQPVVDQKVIPEVELRRALAEVGGATRQEVRAIATRLTVLLRDPHSRLFWIKTVNQARQGIIPYQLILDAVEKRKDPAVERPAACAAAHVLKALKARENRLRGRTAP